MKKANLIVVAVFALALLALPATAGARSRDRDHDKMPDKWEKKFHLSTHKKNAKKDPDHDGLRNIQEFRDHTNPRDADTDNDGMNDGDEVEVGDNPSDRDTDNDGVEDGDEVSGTVQSFDSSTGVLTILESDGTTTRSGTVTDSTEIECDNEAENENENEVEHHGGDLRSADHGGDDGGEACTTADLTTGRVVHEAKLSTDSSGNPVFTKIELDR